MFIRDIGNVRDGSAVQQNVVRTDGKRGVLLSVIKNGNASTLDVVTAGHRPFPLPVSIMLDEQHPEDSHCLRCSTCDGFPCLVQAKADAHVVAVRPALQHKNVSLLTGAFVERIETNATGHEAQSVTVRRDGGPRKICQTLRTGSCSIATAAFGGGQPWSAHEGEALVELTSGLVVFEVRGLVLAGGNTIGTPGAVNQVKGTLVCGPGSASPTVIDSPLVPLNAQGNATFDGSFSSPTAACSATDVAFLIRTAGGAWIGNGSIRVP